MTVEMLRHNPRPDDDAALAPRTRWPVAWKTGTSWGFRDAWAAGIVGPYVLVVWIGNFRGQGNPAFVGVDAAAPLFFRIADALNLARPDEALAPPVPPPGVTRVAVCVDSGDLPNAECPRTVETWYIPGKSPIRVSQLHRTVGDRPADRTRGLPAVSGGHAIRGLRVLVVGHAEAVPAVRHATPARRPRLPDCAADAAEAPRIASPLRGVSYALRGAIADDSARGECRRRRPARCSGSTAAP